MSGDCPMQIEGFFDPVTRAVGYLVLDTRTSRCALVDSVLDFDPKSGRTHTTSADKLIARVRELDAHVEWTLELFTRITCRPPRT